MRGPTFTFERGYVTAGLRPLPAIRVFETGNVYRVETLKVDRAPIQALKSGSKVTSTFRTSAWSGDHRGFRVIADPLAGHGFVFLDTREAERAAEEEVCTHEITEWGRCAGCGQSTNDDTKEAQD